MAKPVPLQEKFAGMFRDKGRDQIPNDKLWDCIDFIPDELGAPLMKRGGWSYHGSTLTSLDASAGVPSQVIYAPFTAGAQVLAVDDRSNCELFDLTNSADRGSIYGAANGFPETATFYRDMVIFPTVGVAPRKYVAAGTISALGGSPPNFTYSAVYKDRLAAALGNRIYFSGAGNAESWDTSLRYIDTSAPIVGLAALRNALLVFHEGSVERIRGSIPPGSAAANMELEPLFGDAGLVEANAVWVADEFVYWADENGVYRSDGSTFTDLTKQGGMSLYWRSKFSSISTVALAVWRGYVWISLLGSSSSFVDFLVYNIDKRYWFRFGYLSNIKAYNFAVRQGLTDEMYLSNRLSTTKQVSRFATVFDPTNTDDGDGSDVSPFAETRYYDLDDHGKKRWRRAYMTYHMSSSGSPSLTLSAVVNPLESSHFALAVALKTGTNSGDDSVTRIMGPLNRSSRGAALQVSQSGTSLGTGIYSFEAEVTPQEGSRR